MFPVNIPNIPKNNQEQDGHYLRIGVRCVYKKVLKDKYSLKVEKYSKIIFDKNIKGWIIYGQAPTPNLNNDIFWKKLYQAVE